MIVVDTNVAVRLVIDDDRSQSDRVASLVAQGPVRLPRTVLLETAWVLRSTYRLTRERLIASLRGLTTLESVEIEDADLVERALGWFEQGLDFADAMHLAAAGPGDTFVTFDRALVRDAAGLAGAAAVQEP